VHLDPGCINLKSFAAGINPYGMEAPIGRRRQANVVAAAWPIFGDMVIIRRKNGGFVFRAVWTGNSIRDYLRWRE